LLVWSKDSYTERFLVFLPCACALQPTSVHLCQISLLLPGSLPIVLYVLQYIRDVESLIFLLMPSFWFFVVTWSMQFYLKYLEYKESLRTIHQDKTAAKLWWTFIHENIFCSIRYMDECIHVLYMHCGERSVRTIYKMFKTIIPLYSFLYVSLYMSLDFGF
jgi:hypothetical protein